MRHRARPLGGLDRDVLDHFVVDPRPGQTLGELRGQDPGGGAADDQDPSRSEPGHFVDNGADGLLRREHGALRGGFVCELHSAHIAWDEGAKP